MTYYTHDNPNHALAPRPRRHPVLGGIRIACLVILALLLICTLSTALVIASVRCSITPEYVYRFTGQVDFSEFPLPTANGFLTIRQLLLQFMEDLGFPSVDGDINLLFDELSIPSILAGYTQDLASWFLHGGTLPRLDPVEIAQTALSGMDESLLAILYLICDPVELLAGVLAEPLGRLNAAGLFAALEPVRFILSADVLAMLLSVCGVLAVLLFCLCSCRLKRYLLPAGLSLLGTGVILSLVRAGIPYIIPRLTLEYAGYLQSFLQPVRTFLGDTALALLVTGLILIAIHLFRLLLVRFRCHPDAPQKSAGGTVQTSADLPEIPGEGADPSASSKENP